MKDAWRSITRLSFIGCGSPRSTCSGVTRHHEFRVIAPPVSSYTSTGARNAHGPSNVLRKGRWSHSKHPVRQMRHVGCWSEAQVSRLSRFVFHSLRRRSSSDQCLTSDFDLCDSCIPHANTFHYPGASILRLV